MTEDKFATSPPVRGGEIVALVVSALQARDIDPAPVLARAGLGSPDPGGARGAVPAPAAYRFVELAAEATHDPVFGLRLIEVLEPRNWGLFYYLIGTAPSVRDALSVAVGNMRLANPSLEPTLTFEPDGSAAWENRYVGLRRSELKHAIEFVFAHMLRLLQGFAGPAFRFASVSFQHERTTEVDAFERFFGCPVAFGADVDRVTLPRESLDLPLLSADDDVHKTLERLARRAGDSRQAAATSYRARVEAELRRLLPGGNSKIEAVADALGMSARSLSRRLAAENATFSGVLDELRRTLAIRYVAKQDLAVSQIAFMVGYEDPSAFSIAFRRWTGTAPSEARADPTLLSRFTTSS